MNWEMSQSEQEAYLDKAALLQEIEQLKSELSTLRLERYQLKARVGTWHDCKAQSDAVDRAQAETRKLEAQLRELTESKHHLMNLLAVIHRDGGHNAAEFGLKVSSEVAEKAVIELRSTIETLQQDLRVIKDIERAGFKRQNELQQNVERLEGEAVKTLSTLKQIAACSCETGHTCVQIARELAERQLAELRSGEK